MNSQSIIDQFKTLPQYLIPHHLLSRVVHKFTRLKLGKTTQWMIQRFIRLYNIDMSIVENQNIQDYASFNEFFTRSLKASARPLAKTGIVSPVDGEISQIGRVGNQRLFQAKGHRFQLIDLMGGNIDLADLFQQGLFCTIYLSPRDYHRIHMPMTGQLTDMIYVPGRLFSVNERTTRVVPNLFARNERIICLFNTEFGPMALILVGALFVGSIKTVWADEVAPSRSFSTQHWQYPPENAKIFQRGDEIGQFNMGSTVILLLDSKRTEWLSEYAKHSKLIMGQVLARYLS